jgi:hypothetical protein
MFDLGHPCVSILPFLSIAIHVPHDLQRDQESLPQVQRGLRAAVELGSFLLVVQRVRHGLDRRAVLVRDDDALDDRRAFAAFEAEARHGFGVVDADDLGG